MLYEVAVVQNPTDKEKKEGKIEELVWGVVTVMAKSEQAAALKATKDIDLEKWDPDRLEIMIRPFA